MANSVELSIRCVEDVMDLRVDRLDTFSKFGFFISLRQYMFGLCMCGSRIYGNIRWWCVGSQITRVVVLTV